MIASRSCIFIFILSIFTCKVFAVSEFDLSYSPLQNGGAEDGLRHWDSGNVQQIKAECPEGKYCFKLSPDNGFSKLTSKQISIRSNEKLRLEYQLMAAKGSFSDVHKAHILVRSYSSDKQTVLDKYQIDLKATDNEWRKYIHEFDAAANAYYVDITFAYIKSEASAQNLYPVYIDDISMHREINYVPLYGEIKPLSAGDTLYVFNAGSRRGGNKAIAMQTIQGVTARNSNVKVWIDTGDNTFTDLFANKYKINFNRDYVNDFSGLLGVLKPYTSGKYILYSMRDRSSISAATTMAGLLDAVAIDLALEETAIAQGYEMAIDVIGKDCNWVYDTYRDKLNHNAIVVHTNSYRDHPSVACLRDIGPALKAIDWWYKDEQLSREVYRSMAPCSPVYGWQDPVSSDEGVTVQIHSQEGLFQIPSDWMYNLTVHAALGAALKASYKQLVSRTKPEKKKGVHYVTFIMSDMDNILTEIGTNSFFSSKKFYANSNRGKFPMSWGMAPSLTELSPAAIDLWYSNAAANESFVGYCGLGYFYPSEAPYMQTHIDRLSKFMKRADLKTLLLIDRLMPETSLSENYSEYAKWFTSMKGLRGLFYMEYVEYAPYNGKIYWFDGKPMVTSRFDFRSEEFYSAVRSTPEKLANSINSLPKDPLNPDSYTFVTVHAWSKGVTDIYETVKLLDPDVEVVHAEDFVELIRMNLKSDPPVEK